MGHRANLVMHRNGKSEACTHKGFALLIPSIIACGDEYVTKWAESEFRENEYSEDQRFSMWDEVFTEGAILINFDQSEIIFGFSEWLPDVYKYPDIPEQIQEFNEFPDLANFYIELIQSHWSGWKVEMALPAEFATQETLVTRISDLQPPLIRETKAATTGWSLEMMAAEFRRALLLTDHECKPILETLYS